MAHQPGRSWTILGQDPSVRDAAGRVLTAKVIVPNEQLSAGPRGYRVQVVDYDASSNRMYAPLDPAAMGTVAEPRDPFAAPRLPVPGRRPSAKEAARHNARLLGDPRFH